MSPVLGIDGGGSGSRAVLLGDDGTELGRATGPPALVDAARPGEAAGVVRGLALAAAGGAGVELPLDALWAGLAGAGREDARRPLEAALGDGSVARRVAVGTDVEAAFAAAFGEGPGVLLVAGTGSIAWGRAEDGRRGRVGGWGSLLGDEGSGWDLGTAALRALCRAEDGRGPPTVLRERLLGALGIPEPEALVRWTASASKAEVAALAPVVADAAEADDPVARSLVADAVAALEGHVAALLERLAPWSGPPALALWGGLVAAGGPLRSRVLDAVAEHGCPLVERPLDPAAAAARLALELGRG